MAQCFFFRCLLFMLYILYDCAPRKNSDYFPLCTNCAHWVIIIQPAYKKIAPWFDSYVNFFNMDSLFCFLYVFCFSQLFTLQRVKYTKHIGFHIDIIRTHLFHISFFLVICKWRVGNEKYSHIVFCWLSANFESSAKPNTIVKV